MPAPSVTTSVLNRTPSSRNRSSKDLALTTGAPQNVGPSPRVRRKQVVAPSPTADKAQRRLDNMTIPEHERVNAYLQHGSAKAAALALGIHEKTVSKTWLRYCADIAVVIADLKRMNENSPQN